MKNIQAITALLGVVCLLAPGALAWPHGSVESCPPGPEPVCSSPTQYDEKLPHPTDCHYWIHCDAGGLPVCKICPANLHFNNVTKDCDWPENAKCTSSPPTTTTPSTTTPSTTTPTTTTPSTTTPSTTTPSTTTPSTAIPTTETPTTTPPPVVTEDPLCPSETPKCPSCDCREKREKHYECEFYYQCDGTKFVLQKCPNDLHFNDELKVCDFPCNAGCNGSSSTPPTGPPPTGPPPTGSPPTSNPPPTTATPAPAPGACPSGQPNGKCPNPATIGDEVYFPHPNSCGHFFQCSNGTPVCMPCPAGLQWNQATSRCDWDYIVKCQIP